MGGLGFVVVVVVVINVTYKPLATTAQNHQRIGRMEGRMRQLLLVRDSEEQNKRGAAGSA